jgi:AcrR family transcriptional regulator
MTDKAGGPANGGATTTPGRGRPRSSAADEAILGATRALLAEGGYDAVTMEAVAARAGVGKTTVYRRHSTRAGLVATALTASLLRTMPEVDFGSLRADLEGVVAGYTLHLTPQMTDVSLRFATEALHDSDARRVLNDEVMAERRSHAEGVLTRAAARGELARHVSADTMLDLIGGAVLLRSARNGGPVDEEFRTQLLSIVVAGLMAPDPPSASS